jgi:hypothetical protein
MGLPIRDERQIETALTGLSPAQCDHLLPVFSAIYRATSRRCTYYPRTPRNARRAHDTVGQEWP